jgi:hypothetical protein
MRRLQSAENPETQGAVRVTAGNTPSARL